MYISYLTQSVYSAFVMVKTFPSFYNFATCLSLYVQTHDGRVLGVEVCLSACLLYREYNYELIMIMIISYEYANNGTS